MPIIPKTPAEFEKLTQQSFKIEYIKEDGTIVTRRIVPIDLKFAAYMDRKAEPQWLLNAYDMDKHDFRTFALKRIRIWYVG